MATFVQAAVLAAALIPMLAWGATPPPTQRSTPPVEGEEYERKCEEGSAAACHRVGLLHQIGAGREKNEIKALPFFQRACEIAPPKGCSNLGNAYREGKGVPIDMARALELYKTACEGGDGMGCYWLLDSKAEGLIAVNGEQVSAWLTKACVPDQDPFVCTRAKELVEKIQLPPEVFQAQQCDAGKFDQCQVLGNTYSYGDDGVAIDHGRAVVAYGRGCTLGNASSCNSLGLKYARGEGVPQDFARAVKFFERACNDRTVEGCVNLGSMYWNGTGVPRDTDRAAALNHQACAGGDSTGCDFIERASVAIMGTPEQQRAENAAQERENEARGAESLQRAYEVNMGGLADHFQREAQTRADADAMLARINSQAATAHAQQVAQSSALADHAQVVAYPVAAPVSVSPASVSDPSPSSASTTSAGSGSVEMFVFFINLGGKTVAFEGPLALSRAEGRAMKARLEGEAPGRYGAGATVDARSRGGGWCAFVYQRPGDERYLMGSETTLSTATNSMKGMVNNLNAVIHHDVVCPVDN